MEVRTYDDPATFEAETAPVLLRAPARHNLLLGIVDLLRRRPEVYPTFHLWAVTDGEAVVGAALRTPPHNLVLAEPIAAGVIDALADALAGDEPSPGVVGALPEAEAFVDAWVERLGGGTEISTRQGIYELAAVRDAGRAVGRARLATTDDLDLLERWHEDFIAEAVPNHIGDPEMRRRRLEGAVHDREYWLWLDDGGRPVSMTGVSPAPPGGARVGPVYTPAADRRLGYATALVAHVSADELAAGRDACYLHTDLANPTSNEIYRRIGYDWVCEAVDLRFVGQSQSGGTGA
jgi:uncharacterized protein